jgi:hypothetical protein
LIGVPLAGSWVARASFNPTPNFPITFRITELLLILILREMLVFHVASKVSNAPAALAAPFNFDFTTSPKSLLIEGACYQFQNCVPLLPAFQKLLDVQVEMPDALGTGGR